MFDVSVTVYLRGFPYHDEYTINYMGEVAQMILKKTKSRQL